MGKNLYESSCFWPDSTLWLCAHAFPHTSWCSQQRPPTSHVMDHTSAFIHLHFLCVQVFNNSAWVGKPVEERAVQTLDLSLPLTPSTTALTVEVRLWLLSVSHTLSLSLCHTHTHTLSLSLSLSPLHLTHARTHVGLTYNPHVRSFSCFSCQITGALTYPASKRCFENDRGCYTFNCSFGASTYMRSCGWMIISYVSLVRTLPSPTRSTDPKAIRCVY